MKLLRWVHDEGLRSREKIEGSAVSDSRTKAETVYRVASNAHLDRLLDPRKLEGDLDGYWIHGRRVFGDKKPHVIPALTCRWNFTPTEPIMLQILVVLLVAKTAMPGDLSPHKTTAFRFENGDVDTVHDYHHVQPTLSDKRAGTPFPGTAPPMSETSPAIPLDARGPVGIAMCAIGSLYAAEIVRQKVFSHPEIVAALRPFQTELPALIKPSVYPPGVAPRPAPQAGPPAHASAPAPTPAPTPAPAPAPTPAPTPTPTPAGALKAGPARIPKPGPPPGYRPPNSREG